MNEVKRLRVLSFCRLLVKKNGLERMIQRVDHHQLTFLTSRDTTELPEAGTMAGTVEVSRVAARDGDHAAVGSHATQCGRIIVAYEQYTTTAHEKSPRRPKPGFFCNAIGEAACASSKCKNLALRCNLSNPRISRIGNVNVTLAVASNAGGKSERGNSKVTVSTALIKTTDGVNITLGSDTTNSVVERVANKEAIFERV